MGPWELLFAIFRDSAMQIVHVSKQFSASAQSISPEKPPPPYRPTTLNNMHTPPLDQGSVVGMISRRFKEPARKFLKELKTCSDECAALAPIDLVVVRWLFLVWGILRS